MKTKAVDLCVSPIRGRAVLTRRSAKYGKGLSAEAGLEDALIHTLRHSWASCLGQSGECLHHIKAHGSFFRCPEYTHLYAQATSSRCIESSGEAHQRHNEGHCVNRLVQARPRRPSAGRGNGRARVGPATATPGGRDAPHLASQGPRSGRLWRGFGPGMAGVMGRPAAGRPGAPW
jgi:hypothetical protein